MLAPHRARHMAVLKFSTSSSHRQYSHILKSYHDLFELNVIDPARHTRSLGSGPASPRAARRATTRRERHDRAAGDTRPAQDNIQRDGRCTHTYPLHVYRIANINQQILSGDNNGQERTNVRTRPRAHAYVHTHKDIKPRDARNARTFDSTKENGTEERASSILGHEASGLPKLELASRQMPRCA